MTKKEFIEILGLSIGLSLVTTGVILTLSHLLIF